MSNAAASIPLVNRCFLMGALVILTLVGCEHSTPSTLAASPTSREFTSQNARHATSREVIPTTKTPTPAEDLQDSMVQVVTVRVPDAPHFEVPQVKLANVIATQRINRALMRLLLVVNLEDTARVSTPAQAVHRAVTEYKANNQIGIFGTSFEVLFRHSGLLSLALTIEYSGAYPWTETSHLTFDTHSGQQVKLSQLVVDTLALRQQWYKRINRRLVSHKKEIAQYYAADLDTWATVREYTGWSDTLQQIRPAMRPSLHEFALTASGLMLYTRFEFPHVALALAPADSYLFPYASVKLWLAPQFQL
jgi:hypothetical protein